MLFRSRHETGLRVTTWSLRLQLEVEPNEVSARKLKLRLLIWSMTSKEVATNHSGRDLNETLRIKNPGHDYV